MKPDFALSLSFEGISLLARAAGGWRVAGEVALDAPDLAQALAGLRAQAVERGGAAFRTKLIIPRDQIRYLTVETGHLSAADRHAEVRRALDGATPYTVDELVYDFCEDGTQTHVAAIARETLDEAEAFAVDHRFNPVSFVAIPGDEAFLGEPFFGPTQFSRKALSPGERVEPDGVAVVIIGTLADEVPEPAPQPEPEPEPEPEPDPQPLPGFSTRRAAGAAPALGGATRAPTPPATAQISPRITIAEPAPDVAAAPVAAPMAAPVTAPAVPAPETRPAAVARPVPGPDRPAEAPAAAPPVERDGLRVSAPALAADDTTASDAPKTWAERFLSRRAAETAAGAPPRPARATPPESARIRPNAATAGTASAKSAMIAAARRPIPQPQPVAEPGSEEDERRRLTVFGARSNEMTVGGKPRHLGLILTAALLVFLAAVAAWASIFVEEGLAGLFGKRKPEIVAVVPGPADPLPAPLVTETVAPPPAETPRPDAGTDAAAPDAIRDPLPNVAGSDFVIIPTPEEAQARYAVTGIWERAPDPPGLPGIVDLESLYLTSIDSAVPTQDAVALVPPEALVTDALPRRTSLPIAPGLSVTFDADGRVRPTPEGAVSPDGFTVFLGRPPVVPPPTPTRFERPPAEVDAAAEVPTQPALPGTRPRNRPEGLVEGNERSQFGGLTRQELAGLRPRVRPLIETPAEAAPEAATQTAETAVEGATEQAVLASLAPRARPSGFADVVAAARTAPAPRAADPEPEPEPDEEPTRVAAAASAAPAIPSATSVARQATVRNAINLRQINLIGVYGTPSNRRALVRLPNGRYQKVTVGDRLDGGQVSAIGDSELRYQKGGRNLTLTIPSG